MAGPAFFLVGGCLARARQQGYTAVIAFKWVYRYRRHYGTRRGNSRFHAVGDITVLSAHNRLSALAQNRERASSFFGRRAVAKTGRLNWFIS